MNIIEKKDIAKRLFSQKKILRSKELITGGLHAEEIKRLLEIDFLQKLGRGLYILSGSQISSYISFAEVTIQVPNAVICLNSALIFHDIGTQNPHSVWFAIPNRNAQPKVSSVSIRTFRFSKEAYSQGIETHRIDGINVKIYSIAKTVADCFKYRNVIGLEAALEALKDIIQNKRASIENISHFAGICRVTKIIKPYIEAIL